MIWFQIFFNLVCQNQSEWINSLLNIISFTHDTWFHKSASLDMGLFNQKFKQNFKIYRFKRELRWWLVADLAIEASTLNLRNFNII